MPKSGIFIDIKMEPQSSHLQNGSVTVKMLLGGLCKVVPRGAQPLCAGSCVPAPARPWIQRVPRDGLSRDQCHPISGPLDAEDLFLSHLF